MSKIDFLYIPEIMGIERDLPNLSKVYEKGQLKSLLSSLILKDEEFRENIRGKTLMLKPNWVIQPESPSQYSCLITHHEFLFAVLEILLELNPKRLIIGDAPIQKCNWTKLLSPEFFESVDNLIKKYDTKIDILDFRRTIWDKDIGKISKDLKPIEDYIVFDLGERSHLEPISSTDNIFRVTDYDPRLLGLVHKKGVHKFCLTKTLFEVDTVITLSKFKTHQKAGVTNAVKTLVGFNGDKDYLPHHRIGGTKQGGDCYPGINYLRRFSEYFLDRANMNRDNKMYFILKKVSHAIWKLTNQSYYHSLSAGWYGNDTTWRMVLDLYLIALCGNSKGEIEPRPVRKLYNLTDGIIGGEGDGPLKPEPFPLGFLSFSDNSLLTDFLYTQLAGIDLNKIPLIVEGLKNWVLDEFTITLNNEVSSIDKLLKHSLSAKPPPGWVGHF